MLFLKFENTSKRGKINISTTRLDEETVAAFHLYGYRSKLNF